MAASQLIKNKRCSYEVFEQKHYMECTTFPGPLSKLLVSLSISSSSPVASFGHRPSCRVYHRQKSNPWLAMASASDALPTSVQFHPWRLGFKQSSLRRIAQAFQDHSIHIFCCSPLSQHALVPSPFRV